MEIKTVYAVYFSATGRTRKVVTTLANAIAQTLELPLETVDFTLPAAREETYAFTDKDLVIFGTPTYAGKVPNKLLPFVQTGFAGNGALAVPVVTFGNRSFDNSLAELCASLENVGFHTIAAGAFACQHAFSDTLAAGRPDREDMTVLAQLGAAVVTKLGKMTEIPAPVQVDGDADAPYYRPLGLDGEPKNFLKAKPQTDRSKCTGCGVCAALCPMGASAARTPPRSRACASSAMPACGTARRARSISTTKPSFRTRRCLSATTPAAPRISSSCKAAKRSPLSVRTGDSFSSQEVGEY